jgi:hypothetical protein
MRISPASIEQFCKKRNPALEIAVPQRGRGARITYGMAARPLMAGYAILQSNFAGMAVPSGENWPYHALHRQAKTARERLTPWSKT